MNNLPRHTHRGTVQQDRNISHLYVCQSVSNKHEAQDKCWYMFFLGMCSGSENQNLHKSWPVQAASTDLHLGTTLTRIYYQTFPDVFHRLLFLSFCSLYAEAHTLLQSGLITDTGYLQFAPIKDSMRSLRLWRSRCTMKSSRERMRKEEMQLTIRRIPPAIESNKLLPSVTENI